MFFYFIVNVTISQFIIIRNLCYLLYMYLFFVLFFALLIFVLTFDVFIFHLLFPEGWACFAALSLYPPAFSCSGHNSETKRAINKKLLSRSALHYFSLHNYWGTALCYVPYLFYPQCISNIMKTSDLKLDSWMDLIMEKCSA